MFLQSWLLFPLVLVVLCLGAGLFATRVAGGGVVPGTLVVPLGLAVAIVVAALLTYLDATAELAGPVLAVIAVAGLVLGRGDLRRWWGERRAVLWPFVAGAAPAAAIAAPVVLTGKAGFTGYGRIVDLAFQIDFTRYLSENGRSLPNPVDSSYLGVVEKMVQIRYPGGAQAALGATSWAAGIDPIWAWQPFLALVAGCLGLSLYHVLQRAIRRPAPRALAAGVAAQPTALYGYALVAGIKELSCSACVALLAALLSAHRPGDGSWRQALPVSLAVAAGFGVINVGVLPWLGVLAGLAFVVEIARRRAVRVRVVANWAALTVIAIVLSVPAVIGALRIAPVAASGGPSDLGNLAAAVPAWATVGPWLTSDYRFPLDVSGAPGPTYVLIAITLALAAVGLVRALAARDWALIGLVAAAAIAVPYIVWRAEPWSEFKAFTISAPFVVSAAFAGAAALAGRRGALAATAGALVAGTVVAGGILAGNALTYHGTTLSPTAALTDLEHIGDRYAGRGPALYPVFDEYGEYLLRKAQGDALVTPVGGELGFNRSALPGQQFVRDPDEYSLAFLERFRLLVLRRDPIGSRPPSDWRLAERTRYFDVWRRTNTPTVVRHFPQKAAPKERSARFCRTVVDALRRAGPGARLAYRRAPEVAQFASPADAPSGWAREGPDFHATGPGRLSGGIALPATGRYTVWLRGSFGRTVDVSVDGRRLAALRWQESYPGLYVPVADVPLKGGPHAVEVLRAGGGLLPGMGNDVGSSGMLGTIGPLAFAPAAEPPVRTAGSTRAAAAVCRDPRPLDWLEVVRGRG